MRSVMREKKAGFLMVEFYYHEVINQLSLLSPRKNTNFSLKKNDMKFFLSHVFMNYGC